ncbi:MAG: arsenate reductase (glutaredoxin) [Campylobacterota bacterium]|nr:arsenate reductase (glutaredoxin) [Campylobacterota bacterium]
MAEIKLWHNPRCSKSRQALALLEEKGIETDIIKYLDSAPDEKSIKTLLEMLGIEARALMRTKEAVYKELELKNIEDEALLIKAMSEHPKLIERPIVIKGDQAIIGRPPERVLEIL